MIVIRLSNDGGVCPIQVVTQDADMAENINFNGLIVQNGTEFRAIVGRMKHSRNRSYRLTYILVLCCMEFNSAQYTILWFFF